MNKIKAGLLLLVLTLVIACRKNSTNDNAIVYGKVTDRTTGNPVADARFYYDEGYFTRDTTYLTSTDEDGNYEINVHVADENETSVHDIYAKKEGYNTSQGQAVWNGAIVEYDFKLTK